MSSVVLKRKYEMQLPINYVEVEKEKMEYIDGGAYYMDNDQVRALVSSFGMLGCGAGTIAATVAAQIGLQGAIASMIPGIGWVAAGYLAVNAKLFAWAVANAVIEGKGVYISAGLPVGINFSVK